jgi:hypothetical protein
MTEHDWALYLQLYDPTDIEDATDFLKTLHDYSKLGNMEAQVAEFRAENLGIRHPELKELHSYKDIIRIALSHQIRVQDGFLYGNSNPF